MWKWIYLNIVNVIYQTSSPWFVAQSSILKWLDYERYKFIISSSWFNSNWIWSLHLINRFGGLFYIDPTNLNAMIVLGSILFKNYNTFASGIFFMPIRERKRAHKIFFSFDVSQYSAVQMIGGKKFQEKLFHRH